MADNRETTCCVYEKIYERIVEEIAECGVIEESDLTIFWKEITLANTKKG